MKTQMTITVDTDTKKEFAAFAKSIGTNSSNLANMLFNKVSRERRINFEDRDSGFEVFSLEENTSLQNNKSIQKNTQILESIL